MLSNTKVFLSTIDSGDLSLTGAEYALNLSKKSRRKILSFLNSVRGRDAIIKIGNEYIVGNVESISKPKGLDPSMVISGYHVGNCSMRKTVNEEIVLTETPQHILVETISADPDAYIAQFDNAERNVKSMIAGYGAVSSTAFLVDMTEFVYVTDPRWDMVTIEDLNGKYRDMRIKDIISERNDELNLIRNKNNRSCAKLREAINKVVVNDNEERIVMRYALSVNDNIMSMYGREIEIRKQGDFLVKYNQFSKFNLEEMSNGGRIVTDDSFNESACGIINEVVSLLSREYKNMSSIMPIIPS